jgi:hypothetical protein
LIHLYIHLSFVIIYKKKKEKNIQIGERRVVDEGGGINPNKPDPSLLHLQPLLHEDGRSGGAL